MPSGRRNVDALYHFVSLCVNPREGHHQHYRYLHSNNNVLNFILSYIAFSLFQVISLLPIISLRITLCQSERDTTNIIVTSAQYSACSQCFVVHSVEPTLPRPLNFIMSSKPVVTLPTLHIPQHHFVSQGAQCPKYYVVLAL